LLPQISCSPCRATTLTWRRASPPGSVRSPYRAAAAGGNSAWSWLGLGPRQGISSHRGPASFCAFGVNSSAAAPPRGGDLSWLPAARLVEPPLSLAVHPTGPPNPCTAAADGGQLRCSPYRFHCSPRRAPDRARLIPRRAQDGGNSPVQRGALEPPRQRQHTKGPASFCSFHVKQHPGGPSVPRWGHCRIAHCSPCQSTAPAPSTHRVRLIPRDGSTTGGQLGRGADGSSARRPPSHRQLPTAASSSARAT
jgi:hypothetical protein